jgi:hypothetical protein
MYMGQEVKSGSAMMFQGEYFDSEGRRYYKGMWPCTFKYIEDGKFYIEVDGKMYYHKKLNNNSIWRFLVLNGKKVPNPITEDDVKAAKILLIVAMAVTSICKLNFLWWTLEIAIYIIYANDKKYS